MPHHVLIGQIATGFGKGQGPSTDVLESTHRQFTSERVADDSTSFLPRAFTLSVKEPFEVFIQANSES